MTAGPVAVRLAGPGDMAFVSASWFECYWKATARDANIPYGTYRPAQDALIRRLLARSKTLVAYAREIPDEIAGYIVLEGDCAHFLYVKHVYRRMGIATGLAKDVTKRYSHATKLGTRIARAKGIHFDPYFLDDVKGAGNEDQASAVRESRTDRW